VRMLVLLVLAGCAGSGESAPVGVFPADFRWGAATAGFQVDMGCPTWSPEDCEDRASDWYQWVTDPEIVADGALHVTGEPVSNGPGMWETFEADVDRMAADGMTAYRMSIEWSRLFPVDPGADATDPAALAAHVDAAALARYGEQLDALRAAGIEPVITLNHYTLPLWVHDGVACHADLATCPARGWVDAAIIDQIAAYSAFCATAFGDRVDTWATCCPATWCPAPTAPPRRGSALLPRRSTCGCTRSRATRRWRARCAPPISRTPMVTASARRSASC
jgi:beta-glucosidase/6-phospho-beta-glucosidase/beta-galactosidase